MTRQEEYIYALNKQIESLEKQVELLNRMNEHKDAMIEAQRSSIENLTGFVKCLERQKNEMECELTSVHEGYQQIYKGA